jgi:hypothetical protein
MPKLCFQTLLTTPFVTLVKLSFHNTTLPTPSLDLTHSLARNLQMFVILIASDVPKMSVTLIAGDPSVV